MGRSETREELTEYEWGSALAYTLEGSAGPFLTARSRWTTHPGDGQTTQVAVEGRFTPRNRLIRLLVWPLARITIRRLTRSVIRELDAFVEAQNVPARSTA